MNVMQYAANIEAAFEKYEKECFGYKRFTTFAMDFGIAAAFGVDAVIDTYKRASKEWKRDIKYVTELSLVLNYLCWMYYSAKQEKLSKVFADLYYKSVDLVYGEDSQFSEKERRYYHDITD